MKLHAIYGAMVRNGKFAITKRYFDTGLDATPDSNTHRESGAQPSYFFNRTSGINNRITREALWFKLCD